MSYKNIAVCLDNSQASVKRLDFALEMARKHEAHLTGMHLSYSPFVVYDPNIEIGPVMMEWEEQANKKRHLAQQQFYEAARKAAVNVDWSNFLNTDLTQMIRHARAADLSIMGQRDTADTDADMGNNFHESYVLKLGRPVLFLPKNNHLPDEFSKIVVAWDGGREASRAMADAMPLLRRAQQVKVMTIQERKSDEFELPDVDIASYLDKHGVKVELEISESHHLPAPEWLLSHAEGSDLLVMGAYGHNRFLELVLGGVTRSIMRKMNLPVLMSH